MPIDPTVDKRLRYDGVETYLGLALASGATTVQFTTPLTHDGGFNVPSLTPPQEYIALSILDANYRLSEIVYLVGYTEGASTGTIERGREGTSPKSHSLNAKVISAATALDYVLVHDHRNDVAAHPGLLAQANAYTDGKMADHINAADPHTQYAKKAGDTFTGPVNFNGASNVHTVQGTLRIPAGATLEVLGDLKVTGRLFLNGREIIASNSFPASPAANTIYIQTFG